MRDTYIDAHVHFWDPGRLGYPWLSDAPSLSRAYLPEHYVRDVSHAIPDQIVFVEADCNRSQAGEEVAWVEALCAREPRVTAIVAHATLDRGRATTDALDALAANRLVRGVRHIVQYDTDPRSCVRAEFVEGVRAAGARGLSFDLCCRASQLDSAAELARLCPDTAVILDHAGKPPANGDALSAWQASIDRLASFPNVFCKLSGLVTEVPNSSSDAENFRVYFDQISESFGAERLLYGSDWPVVTLECSAGRWKEIVDVLVHNLSASEKVSLFSGTARRVYRLS